MSTPTVTSKQPVPKSSATSGKIKRISSGTSRSSTTEAPRSSTPSSVTSSGSRTKSPAAPATRSAARLTRRGGFNIFLHYNIILLLFVTDSSKQKDRRISAQTDVSIPTESESEGSDSETDMVRTRSGAKTDEPELKTYRRKVVKPTVVRSDYYYLMSRKGLFK